MILIIEITFLSFVSKFDSLLSLTVLISNIAFEILKRFNDKV
jgi:hypothetical protein